MQTLSDSSLQGPRSDECSVAAQLVDLVQNELKVITASARRLELAKGNEDAINVKLRHVESRVLWVRDLLARAEAKLQ